MGACYSQYSQSYHANDHLNDKKVIFEKHLITHCQKSFSKSSSQAGDSPIEISNCEFISCNQLDHSMDQSRLETNVIKFKSLKNMSSKLPKFSSSSHKIHDIDQIAVSRNELNLDKAKFNQIINSNVPSTGSLVCTTQNS